MLQLCEKDAADDVLKLLDSAVANAEHNHSCPPTSCSSRAPGPTKARRASGGGRGARSRYFRIRKRTSHVTIILAPLRRRRARRPPPPRGVERAGGAAPRSAAAPERVRRSRQTVDDEDTTTRRESTKSTRSRTTRDVEPPTPTSRVEPAGRSREVEAPAKTRSRPTKTPTSAEADEDAAERARSRGSRQMGQKVNPVRVPSRYHHRLEVALVRRQEGVHASSSSRTGRSATTCASSSSARP